MREDAMEKVICDVFNNNINGREKIAHHSLS
jgi:hypothetical protein